MCASVLYSDLLPWSLNQACPRDLAASPHVWNLNAQTIEMEDERGLDILTLSMLQYAIDDKC